MKANQHICRAIATVDYLNQKGKNIPLLIMGAPGAVKTTTIRDYCKQKNYFCLVLTPSQMSPDDVLGFQVMDHTIGKTKRCTPAWFDYMLDCAHAYHQRPFLFIDELTTCEDFIQGPLLTMISDRILSFRDKLPDDCIVVAAGNYPGQTSAELVPAMANRFVILNMRNEDFDKWELFGEDDDMWDKVHRSGNQGDILNYLGLVEEKSPYSFSLFREWLGTKFFWSDSEVGCTPDLVKGHGLIGFGSTRAVTLVKKFVREYMEHFSDDLWIRIAGDTLGYVNDDKFQSTGKLMTDQMWNFRDEFITKVVLRQLKDIDKDIRAGKKEALSEFKEWLDASTAEEMSLQETMILADLTTFLENRGNKADTYLVNAAKDKIAVTMDPSK